MFVLRELALLDLVFAARPVALGPLAAAQLGDRRLAIPGHAVGLALVLALLVDHDLLVAFAATGQGEAGHGKEYEKLSHAFCAGERCCCCCGGCAPGLPGPSAVPQPQTSEPL